MKKPQKIISYIFLICCFTSCFEDADDKLISHTKINDFIWKSMNYAYLYQENVPDLSDDRFTNTSDYNNFLKSFSTPEAFFENLIYDRENIDRFSWITNNYIALEQYLSGVSKSNGLEFDFYYYPNSNSSVFGIVRLVLPNSIGEDLGLQRGQIFNQVNGTFLTENNLNNILNNDSYTITLANYNNNNTPNNSNDDTIENTNQVISLSKVAYTENPVYINQIIEQDNKKIAYLMYNGFTADYNSTLNDVFTNFKANQVSHLVLDLRYNPGGSVYSASLLASMITGQFNGLVFSKLQFNENLQENNTDYLFTNSFNGNTISSLNLTKVYVLTTDASASASEMLINSLKAYPIEVIQIGQQTVGKSQASITLYDSPDYSKSNVNPNHLYALQPLVAQTYNQANQAVPPTGLMPDITLTENPANYGILGNPNEPFLAAALQHITENGKTQPINQNNIHFKIPAANNKNNAMYICLEELK